MNREIAFLIAYVFCLVGGLIFVSLYREHRAAELHKVWTRGFSDGKENRIEHASPPVAEVADAGADGTDR